MGAKALKVTPEDPSHFMMPRRRSATVLVGMNNHCPPERSPRDFRFWLVFLAIGISTVLTALELSAVSTALPKIVNDLNGSTFVWIGSAYALSATALIPLSRGLAQIFGRRIVMLASLLLMAIGSALCGAATSMNFLIAGRTVQGLGGGGIASTTAIIISDLVPLHERGVYNGLIGIAWAVASGVGPIVGGGLTQAGQWRWLFYLNIPICGIAAVLMFLFLRVRTPPGTLREKFKWMDWFVEHPWSSVLVLVPLILGLVGLAAFVVYEALILKHPIVPFVLMSTFTSLSGYLQMFVMPVVMLGVIYYIPVYFQVCKGASPIGAGVDQLGVALILAPIGILSGVCGYRHPDDDDIFPSSCASTSLAECSGSGVLHVPPQLCSGMGYNSIAYATIPLISGLPEPLKMDVRVAFADSLKVIWQVFVGITGLGLLSSLVMKHLPLHTAVDKDWSLEENTRSDVPHELEMN
ncbi:hypothetical protein EW146_g9180 [Bondarzewia mesenterica]|uniref:Major facilitator superfamily (MFS) profile domain-containing protein n=1 Tax=Bondarzewia mesenterica TaxID=1095465 RepID=A0A4S4LAC2_9AGAM|nr:hypothetical protein EW146_g9180 [Bondarzewia mesenterica]